MVTNDISWLTSELRFTGRVLIEDREYLTVVILKPNLNVTIYLPYVSNIIDKFPRELVGFYDGWKIKMYQFHGRTVTSHYKELSNLLNNCTIDSKKEFISCNKTYADDPWVKIILCPEQYNFTRGEIKNDIDEWGIYFHPEQNNKVLYHMVHEGPEFGHPEIPSLFAFEDNCLLTFA